VLQLKNGEPAMNSKAIIFSAIALLGTAGLLWTGYSGLSSDGEAEHEHGEYYEHARDDYRGDEHEQARSLTQQGDILPLDSILAGARRHHDGRVLETELIRRGDSYVYEVELLDRQGQVWDMILDARTGELLKQKQEH
jgi:uncharacterized membrane protein YkoI